MLYRTAIKDKQKFGFDKICLVTVKVPNRKLTNVQLTGI